MALMRRWRVKRTRGGRIRVELPTHERELLGRLLGQLRELLEDDGDERTRRLFPPAYHLDAEADAEYQDLMREDLLASRLAAIETVESSLGAVELDPQEALAWMQAINSVRLVLGTLLDVSEDTDLSSLPSDLPMLDQHVLYGYLSGLLDELVRAAPVT